MWTPFWRAARLVLVDELAHTNNSGKQTPQTYEDIQEILAARIDVTPTPNIQHN